MQLDIWQNFLQIYVSVFLVSSETYSQLTDLTK